MILGTQNPEYPHYNSEGPYLMRYVIRTLVTLLGACGTAGDFSYELAKCITMNSNACVWVRLFNSKFYKQDWKSITIEEMFHTLGLILKMSLVSICLGRIMAYFNPITKLYIFCGESIELKTVGT